MICSGSLRSQSRFARPDYYTTSLSLCQGVFQKFFKFFSRTSFNLFLPLAIPAEKCPSIISHSLAFVKRFFKSFFNFFSRSFCEAVLRSRSWRPLVDSLHIIALSFPFVKRFLTSFFSLGASLVCHKNVVAVLCKSTCKPSVFVPYGGMHGIGDTHFPRLHPFQAYVSILRDHTDPSRRRAVDHEGLDELIVNI